ncbi:hypothetical protein [Photobacterium sp. 1_MG-2023]|uniref:hypothetical protein n=1 Tax=Photobacterium sp. 1_MG-2023 TaxID=3062646 RepID=UPI0026E42211|nr:hypothetical protein [Photobacterium sp. 1_MG-2023]MDO6707521.1 hypothetical protein [Photobacterium sp. 1_MG-2023]
MSQIFRYSLLLIPLCFFVLLWLGVVFGVDIVPDGVLYDDTVEYTGDGIKPSGLIPTSLFDLFGVIAMIPGFFIGSIYTANKKLWWWFGAYMLIGGLPVGIFSIAVFL